MNVRPDLFNYSINTVNRVECQFTRRILVAQHHVAILMFPRFLTSNAQCWKSHSFSRFSNPDSIRSQVFSGLFIANKDPHKVLYFIVMISPLGSVPVGVSKRALSNS